MEVLDPEKKCFALFQFFAFGTSLVLLGFMFLLFDGTKI
jgi:hypothetical protein